MPRNRLIYFGVIVVAATALIWLGKTVLERVASEALVIAFAVGAAMILAGMVVEAKRKPGNGEGPND